MSNNKKMTVLEWDTLEKEKTMALEKAKEKIETLKVRRGEMLLLIAEGDAKTGRREADAIEKEIKDTDMEIEALLSLLFVIPKRRELARADEIENEINNIEALDESLPGLFARIDAAAENLVLAVRDYYDVMQRLYQINGHKMDFLYFDNNLLDSIGVFLRKYGLWNYIKIGHFRDAKTMTEAPSRARQRIAGLLSTMRAHVKQLRGSGNLPSEICPDCYGRIFLQTDGKRACRECYKVVEG